ncbi:MAG: DEAD/DEAH box helicase [Alphaproteobacteria bacterium]|nr:DEAD/DEAH box helicase [Alphaproteobacteria bacterium]
MSFENLGLNAKTLQAIADAGYTSPTPIQAQAVPLLLQGRDIIALAQTGSGKTASFIWPLLDLLTRGRAKARMPRSLIIEPTRELAAQVAQDFDVYGKYHNFTVALLIGGESFVEQEKKLLKGVDVLIVTPGRLLDLHDRGKILLNDVKMLVLDEADRMLDMGFIPDIERIALLLPPHQTALFSATMPPPIRELTQQFLKDPEEITISSPTDAAVTIEQYIVRVPEKDKREALKALLERAELKKAIVFCNRKREVDVVHKFMSEHGFQAGALHGDLSQAARNKTLKGFKEGEIDILIASNVAARGLDVEDLPAVINFHVPTNPEDYIHRIGRTGRAGKIGKAFTLVSSHEEKSLSAIFKHLDKVIDVYSLAPDFVEEEKTEKPVPQVKKPSAVKKPVAAKKSNPPKEKTLPNPPKEKTPPPSNTVIGFGNEMPAFMRVKA